jgi:hypothetical protein
MAVSYVVRSLLEARDTSLYHAFVDMWALIALALGIVMAVSLLRRN